MLSIVDRLHSTFNTETHQQKQRAAEEKRAQEEQLEKACVIWLNTDVGRFFMAKIKEDRQQTLNELALADPTDINTVRALQTKAQMISRIHLYINEVLLKLNVIRQKG